MDVIRKTVKIFQKDKSKEPKLFLGILLTICASSLMATSYYLYLWLVLFQEKSIINFLQLLCANLFLLFMFSFKKARIFKNLRLFLVLLSLFFGFCTGLSWGVNTPQSLLLYGIAITLTGILYKSKKLFIIIPIVIFLIEATFLLQSTRIVIPNYDWKLNSPDQFDIFIYLLSLILVGIVTLTAKKETENSDRKKNEYSKLLEVEKMSLERKVKLKTQDLLRANQQFRSIQQQKFIQINQLAALGKISSELFHDLVNTVQYSLNRLELAKMKGLKSPDINSSLRGLKQICELINVTRMQVTKQEVSQNFSPAKEVKKAIRFLSYQQKQDKILTVFKLTQNLKMLGNSVRWYQCVMNLLSNAYDSFGAIPNTSYKKRVVRLFLTRKEGKILFKIVDNGQGIPEETIHKIFQPFFSTKSANNGTGIGLAFTKETIENHFFGTIECSSVHGKGTQFSIKIPMLK